jgi:competence protein ComEA
MKKLAKVFGSGVLLGCSILAYAEPLDINKATAEEIDEVMIGVGKVKAEAIVQDREKNGPFKSLEDLDERVKGIGPATIAKNRDKLTVGGAAPAPAGPGAQSAAAKSAAKPQ